MKIHGIGGPGSPQKPGGSREAGRPRADGPAGGGGDRVELSPLAQKIRELAEKAGMLPEIREERVAALRKAVTEGTYQVDAKVLARALLEFEDDLSR